MASSIEASVIRQASSGRRLASRSLHVCSSKTSCVSNLNQGVHVPNNIIILFMEITLSLIRYSDGSEVLATLRILPTGK
jgi:hypothetical protein